jgi:hypothetical protein
VWTLLPQHLLPARRLGQPLQTIGATRVKRRNGRDSHSATTTYLHPGNESSIRSMKQSVAHPLLVKLRGMRALLAAQIRQLGLADDVRSLVKSARHVRAANARWTRASQWPSDEAQRRRHRPQATTPSRGRTRADLAGLSLNPCSNLRFCG